MREDFWGDPAATASYAVLMREVFDIDIVARDRLCGRELTCRPLAFFDADGACVASVEAFDLPLVLDGAQHRVAAIRSVAVASAWRGQGLFRRLMTDLLARLGSSPALLYAEHTALYTPFGFRPILQHRYVGPTPLPSGPPTSLRRLSLERQEDLALLRGLLAGRSPVSNAVAVDGGASLLLAQADGYALDYSAELDAVVVSEEDAESYTLVDVVGARIPLLAEVISAVRPEAELTHVLFPPDKLCWDATAVADDTGLMIRGPEPAALQHGFMLPPTTEF